MLSFQRLVKLTLTVNYNKQFLLLWLHKDYCRTFAVLLNEDFLFQQDRAPAYWSCLLALPCARVHLTSKVASKYHWSKFCGLFSVGSIAKDDVLPQSFRHWPAEMHADRLLDSAKPGHIELSNRSAAKKTYDGYQGEGCPCWISSGLMLCADNHYCYFHYMFKLRTV